MEKLILTLMVAMSADGKIGRSTGDRSTRWTSPDDLQEFIRESTEQGTIILGHNTYKTFPRRPLKNRLNVVYTRDETLLAETPTDSLRYTNTRPEQLLRELRAAGRNRVLLCGGTSVYDAFLPFVSRLLITIEPVCLGNGIPLFNADFMNPMSLTLVKHSVTIGGTIFVEYDKVPCENID